MVLSSGKIFIKNLNGTFNSSKYKALLSQMAVPILKTELGDAFLLQQDNSPVNTSSMIMDYFDNAGISSLSWSAISPDLNIMENIWSMMSKDIYDSQQQQKNKSELEEKIDEAVNNINTQISN